MSHYLIIWPFTWTAGRLVHRPHTLARCSAPREARPHPDGSRTSMLAGSGQGRGPCRRTNCAPQAEAMTASCQQHGRPTLSGMGLFTPASSRCSWLQSKTIIAADGLPSKAAPYNNTYPPSFCPSHAPTWWNTLAGTGSPQCKHCLFVRLGDFLLGSLIPWHKARRTDGPSWRVKVWLEGACKRGARGNRGGKLVDNG